MQERTITDLTYEELKTERDNLKTAIAKLPQGCRTRNYYILRLKAVEQELGVTVQTMADKYF